MKILPANSSIPRNLLKSFKRCCWQFVVGYVSLLDDPGELSVNAILQILFKEKVFLKKKAPQCRHYHGAPWLYTTIRLQYRHCATCAVSSSRPFLINSFIKLLGDASDLLFIERSLKAESFFRLIQAYSESEFQTHGREPNVRNGNANIKRSNVSSIYLKFKWLERCSITIWSNLAVWLIWG